MRAVVCHGRGGPEVLAWEEVPDPRPEPGQLLLQVAATSVNRADLLQRRGLYPPPPGASPILGLEAAGRVVAAAGGFAAGQEVMALLSGGGYAERAVADAGCVLPVPPAVGLPAAGGLMEVFLTAWLNLRLLGGLRAGERVLIHGGAGGVGTAAIQVARALGAEVWVTAGSPQRLERCAELGASGLIDHRQEDFVARLRAAGGADLILDLMGAAYLARNLEALAPDGRLVVIGLQGGVEGTLPLGLLLQRRLRVIGSTLRALPVERKADLVASFAAEALPLFAAGALRVVVDRVLPVADPAAAHRALEAAPGPVGKVILSVP